MRGAHRFRVAVSGMGPRCLPDDDVRPSAEPGKGEAPADDEYGYNRPSQRGGGEMAKGQVKSNKEARKPKKEKPKTNAAAPSMKGADSKK